MKLRYTARAQRHLEAIAEYIAERNPAASRRVGRRIRAAIDLLVAFPELGRAGSLSGTREIVVAGLPYVVVYRLGSSADIVVLGVYHASQKRPRH